MAIALSWKRGREKMQMLTKQELGGYPNEFEAAKAAQDGNSKAWMLLWTHYRSLLMSRIRHVKGFSRDELESEAIALFARKLESFNRNKVTTPEGYSMHSWLFLWVISLNDKLIRQRKREVHLYNERVSAAHVGGGGGAFPRFSARGGN
jgi:DNA-directed RNA polymerase specialized sigma24 family protein